MLGGLLNLAYANFTEHLGIAWSSGPNFNNILDGKIIKQPEVYFWCSR